MHSTELTDDQPFHAHILVVDDEAHNVRLLERLLQKYGYTRVSCLTDPFAVEDAVRQNPPDLLLLDLNMPGVNGLELLERLSILRESNPPVPVLILTGDTRTDTRRSALQLGARDFVNKPFDPPEVLARIRNLLEARLMQLRLLRQNQDLEEIVAARTRELQHSHFEVVRRLGIAAEYRDDETGLHISRVSRYSAILAQAAGFTPELCSLVQQASQLHDIGKIGIPDRILLKAGKLEPEEWAIMQTHVRLGARILGGGSSQLLQMAEEIARTHHERWDGTGYPEGISGEAIPLTGRIVSVCDVFDALTSERPYKRAWSVEEAVAEIVRCAGRQFDPGMVARFQEILPRILEVREELMEAKDSAPPWTLETVR